MNYLESLKNNYISAEIFKVKTTWPELETYLSILLFGINLCKLMFTVLEKVW